MKTLAISVWVGVWIIDHGRGLFRPPNLLCLLGLMWMHAANAESVTIYAKNSTLVNTYTFKIQTSNAGTWTTHATVDLAPGATSTSFGGYSVGTNNTVRVIYGPSDSPTRMTDTGGVIYQGTGAPGTVTLTFEAISVSIYGGGTISEGNTTTYVFTRNGSTSYGVTIKFETGGNALFSETGDFSKDWSISDGSSYRDDDITVPSGSGTKNGTVYIWSDGMGMEASETASVTLLTSSANDPYELQSGSTVATVTIPAN
jgi:hypothetical protein